MIKWLAMFCDGNVERFHATLIKHRVEAGSKDRPVPMRNDMVVLDKDGGREVVKGECHKRWSGA
jgi:hypothetical protein